MISESAPLFSEGTTEEEVGDRLGEIRSFLVHEARHEVPVPVSTVLSGSVPSRIMISCLLLIHSTGNGCGARIASSGGGAALQ
jgi:hypothetical protein